jgi:hypothetical protein
MTRAADATPGASVDGQMIKRLQRAVRESVLDF